MSKQNAIIVKNISKSYKLYNSPKERMKELLHPFKKKYHRTHKALDDISFEVPRGSTFGIIGRNGAGKSTLLQLICDKLTPTSGTIEVKGRISALLELGAGFNRQFTGRENVFLQGALMGIPRQEMEKRFDEIVEFADIGKFIDQPAKTYSSGMYVRLGFAVAINVEPDILIVDEALAVGDDKFKRKCYAKIEEFRNNGKTILLVTHSTGNINQLCDQAILIDGGKIVEIGIPKDITHLYYKMLFEEDNESSKISQIKSNQLVNHEKTDQIDNYEHETDQADSDSDSDSVANEPKRFGNKKAEIIEYGILDENGEKTQLLKTHEKYSVFFQVLAHEKISQLLLYCHIVNTKGVKIFAANTHGHNIKIPIQERGDILEIQFKVTMNLRQGEYFLSLGALQEKDFIKSYDRLDDCLQFKIISEKKLGGIVSLNEEVLIKNIVSNR